MSGPRATDVLALALESSPIAIALVARDASASIPIATLLLPLSELAFAPIET